MQRRHLSLECSLRGGLALWSLVQQTLGYLGVLSFLESALESYIFQRIHPFIFIIITVKIHNIRYIILPLLSEEFTSVLRLSTTSWSGSTETLPQCQSLGRVRLCDPMDRVHRLLCAWGSPGESPGGFLLQGIFPTRRSNLGLPHCGRVLHRLSRLGRPLHQLDTNSSPPSPQSSTPSFFLLFPWF